MADRAGGSDVATQASGSDSTLSRRSKRQRLWYAVAALLVLGGIASSVVGARSTTHNDAQNSRRTFEASSGQIASTLQLAIQHEEDLVVNESAYIAANPKGTNAEFLAWAASVRLLQRYPEMQSAGSAVLVPDDVGGGYKCLSRLGLARGPTPGVDQSTDLCATSVGPLLMQVRDTGVGAYFPWKVGGSTYLAIQTPIYAKGVPETVAARRAAFVAWAGNVVDPNLFLTGALQDHPDLAVSMSYDRINSQVTFLSGKIPNGAESVTVDLGNGWTIETFRKAAPTTLFANQAAVGVLLGGVALSLLLGALVLVLGTGRERALRMVAEQTTELRHQALHDALTGLPNRALITDRIEQLLSRDRRQGTLGSALYVDLDEFKNVNDTLGHEAGDRLLIAVAQRLQGTLRGSDTIGRMGGDEFIVLIDGTSLDVAPELVAQRLLEVMRQPFELEGIAVPLTCSASVGIATGDRASAGELLRDADVALYQAKAAGKNRYAFFHPEMQSEISHRIELEFDLRAALDGGQFHLVYQPIYTLTDVSLVGVEALLRWEHPTRGLVQPDEFIPILEQTGQIREVGRWVLRHACQQVAAWHALGDTLSISVNVSGRQLDDDTIVGDVREALEISGLGATSLIVEVTESALMRNTSVTAQQLQAIKALGVRVAIDDFGTGYSSLAYLQQFHVDCLKIDRTFTSRVTESREAKALLGTLVQLGKDLGLKTLAEGVETTDQLDHLRSLGVDEVQGFLLSRPLGADTLETQCLAPMRLAAQGALPR